MSDIKIMQQTSNTWTTVQAFLKHI